MIEKAIYYTLINSTDITDVISDRIYPVVVPQKVEFPAISHSISSSRPEKAKDEESTMTSDIIQIKVMHNEFGIAKTLGETVRELFDNLKGDVNTVEIDTTKFEGSTILFDEEAEVFMNILTFNFFYKY